ncbi:hypothetical protein SAMN05421819_3836 [Bryocella elongata]|uniref:Uncharacterized protein n=2 Tax=Bryocella elongata TaxID=863522 RepID=A0A1H6BM75_9BACT|nr:hypothetical protein SAMN05421819_3836 [Bryocella elongata]
MLAHATPIPAPEVHAGETKPQAKELSGRDLVRPRAAIRDDEMTSMEDGPRGEVRPAPGANDTPPFSSGPNEGLLWIYALAGCGGVGMVAFRRGGKKD